MLLPLKVSDLQLIYTLPILKQTNSSLELCADWEVNFRLFLKIKLSQSIEACDCFLLFGYIKELLEVNLSTAGRPKKLCVGPHTL